MTQIPDDINNSIWILIIIIPVIPAVWVYITLEPYTTLFQEALLGIAIYCSGIDILMATYNIIKRKFISR